MFYLAGSFDDCVCLRDGGTSGECGGRPATCRATAAANSSGVASIAFMKASESRTVCPDPNAPRGVVSRCRTCVRSRSRSLCDMKVLQVVGR